MRITPAAGFSVLSLLGALALMGCDDSKPTAGKTPDVKPSAAATTAAATTASAKASADAPAPSATATATATASASAAASADTDAPAASASAKTGSAAEPAPEASGKMAAAEPSAEPAASAAPVASAEPEKKPEEKAGKHFGDKAVAGTFAAWFQSGGRYTAGKPGALQAVLIAKGGYKCNPQYPHKVKLNAPPGGIAFSSMTARGASVSPKRTVVSVPFTPSKAGTYNVSGTFHFSVCSDQQCLIEKRPLNMTVTVHES